MKQVYITIGKKLMQKEGLFMIPIMRHSGKGKAMKTVVGKVAECWQGEEMNSWDTRIFKAMKYCPQ